MTFNPMFKSVEKENAKEVELVNAASYKSITFKTLFLIMLTILSATLISVFGIKYEGAKASGGFIVQPWAYTVLGAAAIISFICILFSAIFPKAAVVFGPMYALFQGAVIGALTVLLSAVLKWGAMIALSSTLTVFFTMLIFNMFASFRAKKAVVKIVWVMFVTILIFTFLFLIASLAFPGAIQGISGKINDKTALYIAIAISVFLIIYSSLLLSAQFSYAEALVLEGADKKYEWQAALGILFALVMIYVEIVRLLIIIAALRRE